MGKTHLVEDLCNNVAGESEADTAIAWGCCTAADGPPLWPWRTVMRKLGVDLAETRSSGDLWAGGASSSHAHTAVVDALRDVAAVRPVLLVIDDLHWVDPDSLAVLRLCVGDIRRLPILLVVTMRPDERTETSGQLRTLLTDHGSSYVSIHLRGLGLDAVGQMIAAATGRSAPEALADTVIDRTGGNPLFVRELIRLLLDEGAFDGTHRDDLPLPPLMREILLRRLDRVDDLTRRVLEVAAVAGRSVSTHVLAEAASMEPQRIRSALVVAAAESIIAEGSEEVRFEHDLLRESLVDGLEDRARRRIHAAVAHALRLHEKTGAALSEIAAHLVAAGPVVPASEIADAALQAGRESLDQRAPAVAAAQLRRGLAVADDDEPLTMHLALELGHALAMHADKDDSCAAFDQAWRIATVLGDADVSARAAVGEAGMAARPRTDPELVARLEEALARRADRRDALTAEVMASLAHSLLFTPDVERRSALADDAVAIAREANDPSTLAHALYVWLLVHQTSTNFDTRLGRAQELLAVARVSGSPEIEASALHHHARHMAESGDYVTFDADVAACGVLSRETSNATWQWITLLHQAMRATMRGDFIDAERLGDAAFGIGSSAQNEAAGATYGAHLMSLRTWQGRLGELLPLAIASSGQYRELPAVWASVPYIRAEVGALEEAAAELDQLVDDDRMRDLPGAQSWTVAVAMLARVAHLTGSARAAVTLRGLLEPLGTLHIVGPYADCYFGPASLYRGLTSAAIGDLDLALDDLTEAVQSATAAGAPAMAAWAMAELAVVQYRLGDPQAETRRQSAAASLKSFGMHRHLLRLESTFGAPPLPPARPTADDSVAPVADTQVAGNEIVRADDGWSITFDGTTVVVDAMKGIGDIHRLVGAPDTEIHALELMGGTGGTLTAVGTQTVLDEKAKRGYRARLAEIELEIDDADRCADLARSERAQLERDALIAELQHAVGFGGRDRTMPAEPERARQAVRARIRYAMDRIERAHPDLHRHLRSSITTGMYCVYRPERPVEWRT